jgi:hypothetical protein
MMQLDFIGRDEAGAYLYKGMCLRCGFIGEFSLVRTLSQEIIRRN